MPRQSHQRGKGGLWIVDYSKPDVYSRKVGARRVACRSPIRSADALLDPCVSLSQRGKRGPSAKSSPKSGAVPLLPYGLVSMGADQDGTDEASGSGSGWSSTDDHAGGRYHPGPGSNWSLSPQMPLEASPAAYYPATGQPVPQTFASAYQPMTMCPPGASSSTSSRSSIASRRQTSFRPGSPSTCLRASLASRSWRPRPASISCRPGRSRLCRRIRCTSHRRTSRRSTALPRRYTLTARPLPGIVSQRSAAASGRP
jgi:hypothetical protein